VCVCVCVCVCAWLCLSVRESSRPYEVVMCGFSLVEGVVEGLVWGLVSSRPCEVVIFCGSQSSSSSRVLIAFALRIDISSCCITASPPAFFLPLDLRSGHFPLFQPGRALTGKGHARTSPKVAYLDRVLKSVCVWSNFVQGGMGPEA